VTALLLFSQRLVSIIIKVTIFRNSTPQMALPWGFLSLEAHENLRLPEKRAGTVGE
jgi:hypothetical protein